jgi:hypothetical protein
MPTRHYPHHPQNPPGAPPKPPARVRRSNGGGGGWRFLNGIVFGVLLTVGALAGWEFWTRQAPSAAHAWVPSVCVPIKVPGAVRGARASNVIYLNREGAVLRPGGDDSSRNQTSLAKHAGSKGASMPAWGGGNASWDLLVKCIRGHFSPYNVSVVDRRPVTPGYLMTVIGGTPDDLGGGHAHEGKLTGLAPFSGKPIAEAIVVVFSETMKNKWQPACETAAMEIAHAYGLDHSFDCKDLMTYKKPCGPKSFIDKAVPCGEEKARKCKGGSRTQNSHRALWKVLGTKKKTKSKKRKKTTKKTTKKSAAAKKHDDDDH